MNGLVIVKCGGLVIVLGENCEDFKNDSNGGSGGENAGLPSLDSLTPGSKLYNFVSNPNVRPDGNGNYIINYDDPDFIDTEEYRSYPAEPDQLPMRVQVNFKNQTAFVVLGDMAVDQSRKFFLREGDTQ